jgi:hypothetical protein
LNTVLACLLVAAAAFAGAPAWSEESHPQAVTGGMTIYIDPQTGTILRQPAPGSVPLQIGPELRNALSTSHQGLFETPSAAPDGGVKVDLQGRFQSPLIVTIDGEGTTRIQHLGETPAVVDAK